MTNWNLKELRELTNPSLSIKKQKLLSDFLDSFDWKNKATYYHILQADESFKDYINLDGVIISHKLLSGEPNFGLAKTTREISLVSAVMVANTLTEVLAQIINIVMLANKFSINKVTLSKVLQEMPSGNLKSKLERHYSSSDSNYIRAFTNTLKHINLVKANYHISYEGDCFHGVKFKEFEYRDSKFPEQRDIDIINLVKRYRTTCVELGSEINNEIR